MPPYSKGTGDSGQVQAAMIPADAVCMGIHGMPLQLLPGKEKSFALKRICIKIE